MLGGELKNDLEKHRKRKSVKYKNSGARAVFGKGGRGIGSFGGGLILVMVSITLVYWFQN